jgi:hypothetical protein
MDRAMLFLPSQEHQEMSGLQLLAKDVIMLIAFMQGQVNNLFFSTEEGYSNNML